MRYYFFVLLVLITSRAQGQEGTAAIQRLLDLQTKAWNRGDLEGYMQTYWKNDSLLFIGKSGITKGWSQTLANYKKGYPDKDAMGTLSFEIIKIIMLTSHDSCVIGKWTLKRNRGDVRGHYTLLVKKIRGEWKIIADHSS